MKNGKAPGPEKIMTEQIKQFGTKTKQWLSNFLNSCHDKALVPKTRIKAKVVALKKTRKRLQGP